MAQMLDDWLVDFVAEAMKSAGCKALTDARESGFGPPLIYAISDANEILVRVKIDRSPHDPLRVNGVVENVHHGQLTWNATAETQNLADPATLRAISDGVAQAVRFMRG